MNITTKEIGFIGVALGAVSLVYTFYIKRQFERDIVNKISEGLPIDIPNEIINEAIEIAVGREVSKVVTSVSSQIVFNARQDIHREVKSTVEDSFSRIKSSVSAEVAKEVANIDMRRLKRDVEEKAKELIVEKFDGNLDSLLSDFNGNLKNVAKIYSSIADSLSKKNNSEAVFKIGI